ncbi:MAG TPA: hypothetical protein IAC05_05680, partial [Candidatus Coprenecus stercorigallinarum]|nr:hypothetical protein [Candidatus Coprenecus stercorigallinarum]
SQAVTDSGAEGTAESAVLTVVDTVVAYVEGGKKHDTVAVYRTFQFTGRLEYLIQALRRGDRYKCGCFLYRQRLFGKGFLKDFPIDCRVFLGIVYQGLQSVVVDKVDKAFSQFCVLYFKI